MRASRALLWNPLQLNSGVSQPQILSPFYPAVDDSFRLDEVTRSRIAPDYDADALERLLQALEAEARALVLEEFLRPECRTPPLAHEGSWRTLVGFTDPKLSALLAEVWQPFWTHQPAEVWADPHCQYPGRDLARQRRERAGREGA